MGHTRCQKRSRSHRITVGKLGCCRVTSSPTPLGSAGHSPRVRCEEAFEVIRPSINPPPNSCVEQLSTKSAVLRRVPVERSPLSFVRKERITHFGCDCKRSTRGPGPIEGKIAAPWRWWRENSSIALGFSRALASSPSPPRSYFPLPLSRCYVSGEIHRFRSRKSDRNTSGGLNPRESVEL